MGLTRNTVRIRHGTTPGDQPSRRRHRRVIPARLRHFRLTRAGEDGTIEANLMNLSDREYRRSLQRYFNPSKNGTHRRLDELGLAQEPGTRSWRDRLQDR